MDTLLSIIIPAHNAGKTLGWCLEGVTDQDYAGDFEVLVVESGERGYIAGLSARFPRARFILAPLRLYSGQARNVATRYASGGTLVFLDADCRPGRGWLSALSEGHDRGYEVISGAIGNGNPDSLVATAEYLVSHSSYSSNLPSHELAGTTAASGNMSVSRGVYDEVGGFAGTQRANDFIFSRRLEDGGVRMLFCPGAEALHLNPDRLKEYVGGQVTRGYWNARARIELGKKGSITQRIPPLAFALFFLRAYRMVDRCIRHGIVSVPRLSIEMPLCLLGIAAWTWGYFKASLVKNSEWIESERLPGGWERFEIIQPQGKPG